jgi:hypothetical protein
MQRVTDSARKRNSKDAAQRRGGPDSFGARRGKWLDQVHNDPRMNGHFHAMYAIARGLDRNSFTCRWGDDALAALSHVCRRTMERAREAAQECGHIEQSFHGRNGMTITPILHSEGGQNAQVNLDTSVDINKRKPRHKPRHKPRQANSDSLVESSESSPISHISHVSQEREDSAANAAAPLEEGAQESNAGHVNENTGTTESPTSGTTESAMSDAEKAELGKLRAELAVLEAEQERLNRIGCSLTACGLGEIKRIKAEIAKIEYDAKERSRKERVRKAVNKLAAEFATDGTTKAQAPGGIKKLEDAIELAQYVDEHGKAKMFRELLAGADPKRAPFESEAALFALVGDIRGVKNPGALAASLIKAHGDNVRQARIAFNEAVKREPRNLQSYLWSIVRKETEKRNRPHQVIL